MTGEQTLIVIGIILGAGLIAFAIWRFPRLGLRLKGALGEAELNGNSGGGESDDQATSSANAHTHVAGSVQGSTIITAGGSIGEAKRERDSLSDKEAP